jgi:hypothetical protein
MLHHVSCQKNAWHVNIVLPDAATVSFASHRRYVKAHHKQIFAALAWPRCWHTPTNCPWRIEQHQPRLTNDCSGTSGCGPLGFGRRARTMISIAGNQSSRQDPSSGMVGKSSLMNKQLLVGNCGLSRYLLPATASYYLRELFPGDITSAPVSSRFLVLVLWKLAQCIMIG